MANIKSAKKRIKIIERKTLENKRVRSRSKTTVKKVVSAVLAGNKNEALSLLNAAYRDIDLAAKKGVYHKNNAGRKKAKLAKMINKMG